MFSSSSPIPDPIRLSLEAESRKWFVWLLIAGAVVALGCILEIPETRFSLMQWWRQKRGLPSEEENPTSWRIPAASIGLLLVILGVLGEVVFEGLSSNADARLRTHESEVLSNAETQAGSANERASEAQREAAHLRKDAEDERTARVEMQEALAPRRLALDQKVAIGNTLRNLGERDAQMLYHMGDREAEVFAIDIWEALHSAQWKVFSPATLISGDEVGSMRNPTLRLGGVFVLPAVADANGTVASTLVAELTNRGFDATVTTPASEIRLAGKGMQITVATRPLGPQGAAKLRAEAKRMKQANQKAKP